MLIVKYTLQIIALLLVLWQLLGLILLALEVAKAGIEAVEIDTDAWIFYLLAARLGIAAMLQWIAVTI